MRDLRYIGHDTPRPEAPDKAAGKALDIFQRPDAKALAVHPGREDFEINGSVQMRVRYSWRCEEWRRRAS